ncbi:carbohydrate kinase family protein [Butyrivibrio sp. VCB2001]|uniref:carbohydrate kinase family protein n=1 Tax=Butyrivibrio sp. VCB2001 TaxID=1280667 RepID=UPI0003FED687|nr:carbohydrate kinase family protein [Butyrivibrio sp. VCB2001]
MSCKVTVIGAAIVDIFAGAVDKEIFTKGSVPARDIGMSCGGDALNEAVTLSGLGNDTEIISLLGDDEAGGIVKKCLDGNKVDTRKITVCPEIPTATNIVLVDSEGERYFITNPRSSLRKLSKEHILSHLEDAGDIVSFASIFVSPKLGVSDMKEVFERIKQNPSRILVADMTTAKNGETIKDLEPILKYIDYIIPNEKEASILTGESDPVKSAGIFIKHGANTVIIKCGKEGCVYKSASEEGRIQAYSNVKAVDTTGAGDSFVAGFIHGLSIGLSLQDSCRYGCAVSSVVVEHMGTQGIAEISYEAKRRYQFYGCSN